MGKVNLCLYNSAVCWPHSAHLKLLLGAMSAFRSPSCQEACVL
jgi:hypothetical protein